MSRNHEYSPNRVDNYSAETHIFYPLPRFLWLAGNLDLPLRLRLGLLSPANPGVCSADEPKPRVVICNRFLLVTYAEGDRVCLDLDLARADPAGIVAAHPGSHDMGPDLEKEARNTAVSPV